MCHDDQLYKLSTIPYIYMTLSSRYLFGGTRIVYFEPLSHNKKGQRTGLLIFMIEVFLEI